MAELDYYTVMQKKIDYLAKKYDPHDRYSLHEIPVQAEVTVKKPRKIRKKVLEGFSYFISLLF